MPQKSETGSRIVLFGLTEDLADSSRKVLAEQGHIVYSYPFLSTAYALALIKQVNADFVFCDADPEHYTVLLEALKHTVSSLPLVVVSRQPDTSAWLDALQAGASDYCAPPFESISIRWILESALTSRRAAA